jgi:hypothetical protein
LHDDWTYIHGLAEVAPRRKVSHKVVQAIVAGDQVRLLPKVCWSFFSCS